MTVDKAICEWKSMKRTRGCVSATDWFCKRVKNFYPERLTRYTKEGDIFEHVIATDGTIRIDLAPNCDRPRKN